MIILDEPYVSDFLLHTINLNRIPIVRTPILDGLDLEPVVPVLDGLQAAAVFRERPDTRLYTNSENAIGWISRELAFTDLPERISMFKNKLKFRRMLKPMYPDFYFHEAALHQLLQMDPGAVPFPVVIKPAVGFFSMGVHKVHDAEEWRTVLQKLEVELEAVQGLYPREVMDGTAFIIEECFPGEEFAVDAFYDERGQAVVVNIHKHIFSSSEDVSDRVYISSRDIILDNLVEFTEFLNRVGELAGVCNFPVHLELRRQENGMLLPIEVNPMRFGGWCSTGDAAYFAYGLNAYTAYIRNIQPDWHRLLDGKDGRVYGLVVLDNSTGMGGGDIVGFDYEKLARIFTNVLELRKIDHKAYPVFGFVFTETPTESMEELRHILTSNLREFILPAA